MVAITAPAHPLPTRRRVRRDVAPPLRLVSPGGRSVDLGGRSLAELLLAAVLVAVTAFAVTYLVRAEAPAPAGQIPVLDGGHVVETGETMWSIATEVAPAGEAAGYVERLVEVNGTATVHAGQVLALPVP